MKWTPLNSVVRESEFPPGYSVDQLGMDEIDPMTRLLRDWYPDIVVGAESCHLVPEWYRRECSLKDRGEDRPVFPIVLRHGEETVGLLTLEKDAYARALTSRMAAIAPGHRGSGIPRAGMQLLERMAAAIGAELIYLIVTLKSVHQQMIAEKNGYVLAGILPAFDRDMVSRGSVKRVYEAFYAKVLVPREQICLPPDHALTPNTRRVWEQLFLKSARPRVAVEPEPVVDR